MAASVRTRDSWRNFKGSLGTGRLIRRGRTQTAHRPVVDPPSTARTTEEARPAGVGRQAPGHRGQALTDPRASPGAGPEGPEGSGRRDLLLRGGFDGCRAGRPSTRRGGSVSAPPGNTTNRSPLIAVHDPAGWIAFESSIWRPTRMLLPRMVTMWQRCNNWSGSAAAMTSSCRTAAHCWNPLVGGQRSRGAPVPGVDELEEVLRSVRGDREVADLVHDPTQEPPALIDRLN